MEETSEYSTSEMPDVLIPAVDVQMVVDDNPLVFNDDPEPTSLDKYKEEMLKSGLIDSDFEYFSRAYKNLKEVKYIKIHCTSCDKHLGSAADQKAARYEHPLLRVVICERCYVFYSSGDFEKDEDGSELYCRWCGEGGEVYCCTKCPYVFCKKCIRRNLGRGTARLIQNSDNWMCFACSPPQINRHRATYWALQKYSDELLELAKKPNSVVDLSIDGNICCISTKKRAESHGKLKSSNTKKSKLSVANSNSVPQESPDKMPSTSNANNSFTWQSETNEDLDEVICTPDIIPIDDSPPGSPKPASSPAVIQPNVQVVTQQAHVATLPPLRPTTTVQTSMQMAEIQKQLQKAFQQKIFLAQTSQMCPKILNRNPVIIKPGIAKSAAGNFVTLNDSKYKFVISNSLTKPAQNVNTNYFLTPVTTGNTIANTAMVQQPVQIANKQMQILNKKSDWFDQAVLHCTEVTTYITTKISSLAGVHTRAYKSEQLMDELHTTLQTYMQAAIEKMQKVKKTMKENFESERVKEIKLVNPYAKRKRDLGSDESSFHGTSMSEVSDADSTSLERPKKRRRKKYSKCAIETIKPEDVPFDMTVTNASDEELSMTGESRPHSPNDVELVGEITTKGVSNEIISLLETTDDEVDDEGSNEEEKNKRELKSNDSIVNGLMKELKSKLNFGDLESTELLKHLSAVVLVEKSKEIEDRMENNDASLEESRKSNDIKIEEIQMEAVGKQSDESNEDDGVEKLVDNVDKMENDEEMKASATTHKSNKENLNVEEAVENDTSDVIEKDDEKEDNKTENEVEFDVEEMLNSAVVPKTTHNASNSFGDVFSKFITREDSDADKSGATSLTEKTNLDENETIASEVSSEKISQSISSSPSFPFIDSDIEEQDNSCLSLPPDGLMEYCMNNVRNSVNNTNNVTDNVVKCTEESKNVKEPEEGSRNTIVQDQIIQNNETAKNTDENSSNTVKRSKRIKGKKKNGKKRSKNQSVIEENSTSEINKTDKGKSEVIIESEIMTLKQMAENCVDLRKASAECKG